MPPTERDFTLCADMFKLLNVERVRLLDQQPEKSRNSDRKPGSISWNACRLIVGRNPKNAHYLDTKAAKMGHLLNN
ncbi:GTP cyclohydrolase-2 [Raoultella terrigena]|uniref:GTP cyclohydrolase-2 n=1 Tax=Raoultella terrigena TaxID=577 RepID=A0A4U9CZ34_RAOTE|nr:GTP cyclohydrolase-2 [Raoultella terrigena]